MIKKIKAFKNKRLAKKQGDSAGDNEEEDALPLPPPPPPKAKQRVEGDGGALDTTGNGETANEVESLRSKVTELEIMNRTLVQDMEDQKLAFEARHNSMMAVLHQQTEEHNSKNSSLGTRDQKDTSHQSSMTNAQKPEEVGINAKYESLLSAHEKTREEVNDLKSLLQESRARLDKVNGLYEALLESSTTMEKDLSDERDKLKKQTKTLKVVKQERDVITNQLNKIEADFNETKANYLEKNEEANKVILELRENVATIENELMDKRERLVRAEESATHIADQFNKMNIEMDALRKSEAMAKEMREKSQGQTNAAKKKAASIRKDISKIFRVCEATTLDDIVTIVRERREFQVQLTMAKAEKRAAEDELASYKDALKRQLIENVKPEKRSVMDRIRKRSPSNTKNQKDGGGSLPSYTVTDLQNLANNLMEKLDERDERMKLKEFEKRQLFDRIIELETRLRISQQGRDSRSSSVVDEEVEEAAAT